MRNWKNIGGTIALLGEVALQVSGYTNVPLAIILGFLCIALFVWSAWPLLYKHVFARKKGENPVKTKGQLQSDLVKLLHDGKDILAKLKQAQNIDPRTNVQPQVTSEIYFEAWFANVTKALANTDFKKIWYENKVVNYRDHSLSNYIGASERALERLESILQLASHKEGSQS